MTVRTLINALYDLLEKANTNYTEFEADDYYNLINMIETMLNEIGQDAVRTNADPWDTYHAISSYNIVDVLNETTYKDYARVYRRKEKAGINPRPTFDEYMREVDKNHCFRFAEITMKAGYDFIEGLFAYNEANNTPCDEAAQITDHIRVLMNMVNK